MKNLTLLILFLIFSCTKEDIPTREIYNFKKPINSITLSTDSLNKYNDDDWFSLSSKKTYNVSTDFYHKDTLGNMFNLTPVVKRNYESFYVNYEFTGKPKSIITIVDKPLGLLFIIKTDTNETDTLNVKLYQNNVLIYNHKFPLIVSAS
jgi:hypothetical protein